MRAEPSTVDTTQTALTERYLEHARVQKRLAPRTVALYSEDLHKLTAAAAQAGVARAGHRAGPRQRFSMVWAAGAGRTRASSYH